MQPGVPAPTGRAGWIGAASATAAIAAYVLGSLIAGVSVDVRERDATILVFGALPAGIGLQVIPTIVSVYVKAAAGLQAVRLFLVLAVVLLAVSLLATLVLVGAGIAASAERRARVAAARRTRARQVAATPRPSEPEPQAVRAPS